MVTIKLTRDKTATIDESDYDIVSCFKWNANKSSASKNFYAQADVPQSGKRGKKISMHGLIMRFPSGEIDHVNGDSLDNRRENLRLATRTQNARNRKKSSNNTSGFKGVIFLPNIERRKKFIARIWLNEKHIFLGRFMTAIEAAVAYNIAASELHGEFACLNHIPI